MEPSALGKHGATGMWEGGGGSSLKRNGLGGVGLACGFWLFPSSFQEEAESGRLGSLPSQLWAQR